MVKFAYAYQSRPVDRPRRNAQQVGLRLLAVADRLGEALTILACLLLPLIAALWEAAGR